jgi:sn-glycerol 3-phosphate transport system substrate-binding protein
VPTAGYYTDSKTGHLLSQPFNSSTPVLYYNKDAFKKAGLDPEQPPKTWQDWLSTPRSCAAEEVVTPAAGRAGIQIENFSLASNCQLPPKTTVLTALDAVLSSTSQSRGETHCTARRH